MVGYLFVLYKVDKPRKKVRAVLSVRFQYFSKWGTIGLLPSNIPHKFHYGNQQSIYP